MIPIKLKEYDNRTGMPCKTYKDAEGNLYWKNLFPADMGTNRYGRLFKGTVGDKSELANLVYELDGIAFSNLYLNL